MKHYSTDEEILEYLENTTHISQSQLKSYYKSRFNRWNVSSKDVDYETKLHFILGSAVDDFLTRGEEHFVSKYTIANCNKPTKSIETVINCLVEEELEFTDDNILECCVKAGYYSNLKDENRIAKIKPFESWFHTVKLSKINNNDILTKDEYDSVIDVVYNIIYAFPEVIQDKQNIDIYYQLPLYDDTLMLRGLLDVVIVDHSAKSIKVIDIKTSSQPTSKFKEGYDRYGYGYQACQYTTLVANSNKFKELVDSGYEIYFSFIIGSFANPEYPREFIFDRQQLELYTQGNENIVPYKKLYEFYKKYSELDDFYELYPKQIKLSDEE